MKIKKVKIQKRSTGKTSKVYFFPSETMLENIVNRFDRPYTEYRKLLPKILGKANIEPTVKARWSQYAGCSCGCSPAFILSDDNSLDIFVDIS